MVLKLKIVIIISGLGNLGYKELHRCLARYPIDREGNGERQRLWSTFNPEIILIVVIRVISRNCNSGKQCFYKNINLTYRSMRLLVNFLTWAPLSGCSIVSRVDHRSESTLNLSLGS